MFFVLTSMLFLLMSIEINVCLHHIIKTYSIMYLNFVLHAPSFLHNVSSLYSMGINYFESLNFKYVRMYAIDVISNGFI